MKNLLFDNMDFEPLNANQLSKLLSPQFDASKIVNYQDQFVTELKQQTENQKIQINQLNQQLELAQKESKEAKSQCKRANVISIISALIALAALAYEIIINAIH